MKKLAQRILSATAGIVMVAGLATAEAAEPIKIGSVLSATGPAAFLRCPRFPSGSRSPSAPNPREARACASATSIREPRFPFPETPRVGGLCRGPGLPERAWRQGFP